MNDAQFNLKGIPTCHNCPPKINKCYYNIHGSNTGSFYKRVCRLFTPGQRTLCPNEQMPNLTHYLCTCGEFMCSYIPRYPAIVCGLSRVFIGDVGRYI